MEKRPQADRLMAVLPARESHNVADRREILSAEQLDAMTPNKRAQAFWDRIATDPPTSSRKTSGARSTTEPNSLVPSMQIVGDVAPHIVVVGASNSD
jgi:hypothetical protein